MNSKIKAKWVAALRSGAYAQGKKTLKTLGNQYCCLGVLCELAVQDGVIEPPTLNTYREWNYGITDGTNSYGAPTGDLSSTQLPDVVREWAGLEEHNPCTRNEDNLLIPLADDNDDGASFIDIANLIERNL